MNEMQVFENKMFGQLRTVEQNGQTWFVAADVCRALEITNSGNAISRLDADEKMTVRWQAHRAVRHQGGTERLAKRLQRRL